MLKERRQKYLILNDGVLFLSSCFAASQSKSTFYLPLNSVFSFGSDGLQVIFSIDHHSRVSLLPPCFQLAE